MTSAPSPVRSTFRAFVDETRAGIAAAGRWRTLRTVDSFGPEGSLDGAPVVTFASNDYLGLSTHPTVIGAAHAALDRWGAGATASRLVVGTRPAHEELEDRLARWKGTEAAVCFPNGYAANVGLLTALGDADCTIVSDERNHASIIDGCRLARAAVAIARHNDLDHIEALLADRATSRAIVVVDAVYSMDGDEAPVADLLAVCRRHDALLVLDEAHAVLGPDIPPHEPHELLRVVTMSKALGALGGAVCGPRDVIEVLVNRARPLIFSTGLAPADAAAAGAAIDVVDSPEGTTLLERLRTSIDRLAPGHPSPIVPIIVGDEDDAVAAADRLLVRGLLVPAIRPPTVAPGTSRLRIALSSAHHDDMLDRLVDGLVAEGLR